MANTDLKTLAREKGVYLWQIADSLNMHDSGLSRKLRKELPTKEKERIHSIIEELSQSQIDEEGSN